MTFTEKSVEKSIKIVRIESLIEIGKKTTFSKKREYKLSVLRKSGI